MRRIALVVLTLPALVVAAQSASGAAWRVPLGNGANAGHGSFLTALPGDRVLAATSQGLFAYDSGGREVWEKRTLPVQRGRPAAYTPVMGPDGLLYMVGPKRTVVLRPVDGSRVTAYDSLTPMEGPWWSRRRLTLVAGGERVVGSFGDGVWASQARVLPTVAAVVSGAGAVALTPGYLAGIGSRAIAFGPGTVYTTTVPDLGRLVPAAEHLVAVDGVTGALRWNVARGQGGIVADAGGVVATRPDRGGLIAYRPSGEILWIRRIRGARPLFLARGVVVAAAPGRIVAVDAGTGRSLAWPAAPREGGVRRAGVVSGRTLYLMWNGGHVRSAPLPARAG